MAEAILMPRQGNTVESCIILTWKKDEGSPVSEGESICEVETDKATFEVESTVSGVLLKRFFAEGDDVPVLTPIAAIGNEGEDVSHLAPAASGGPATTSDAAPGESVAPAQGVTASAPGSPASPTSPPPGGKIAISPRARLLADNSGVSISDLAGRGTGPKGRIIERDVAAIASSGEPLTKAAIQERLRSGARAPAEGSGIGGRVRVRDLVAAGPVPAGAGSQAIEGAGAPVSGARSASMEFPGPYSDIKATGVRKVIAERMHASLRDTAQLTLHTSADARAIQRYRKLLKASDVDKGLRSITINDIILFAAVHTLREHPEVNAHFENGVIRRFEHVHAAFAVDTERGLIVPVIRFADTHTLKSLTAETNRLADACKDGSITPDELSGGSITVSNLGALGIEMFTPILNPPQVAILGVCSVVPKPVQTDSGIELIPHIGLSMTIDHRAVDGAPASWFLKDLCDAIASFDLILAG